MKIVTLILALLIANTCLGQNIFKNEMLGFDMEHPENWVIAKNNESVENIKRQIKLDAEKLNKLLEQSKGSIQVVTFYKYPLETSVGVVPTIKVVIRKNNAPSFDYFKKSIEESFVGLKKIFPDFEYLTSPVKTQISGLDCVKAVCAYTIKTKNSQEKIKVTVYSVPVNNQFYQISFIDSEKEDNTELYNKLLKKIVIY